MFSLNVPLPPAVERLAEALRPKLTGFDRVRDRHTLVCKRFGTDDVSAPGAPAPERNVALATLREDLRPVLAGTDPFRIRVTGVDAFESPARGPGPVVYLAVESEALERLHRRLCRAFDPIEGIEGADYVPHVTLARGGDPAAVERVVDADVDAIEWGVDALALYDPDFREVAGRIEL